METLYPASFMSSSNWFMSTEWTKEENKAFESALAMFDQESPDRWVHIAQMIPGKTVWDVMKKYEELIDDVKDIEEGRVPIPVYLASSFTLELVDDRNFDAYRKRSSRTGGTDQERKKGVPWTEEEHRRFLMGLLKYGKGDWRNISRNYVISKTPTQVASHAQKYFIRQHSGGKDKRRPSIHDITTVNLTDTTSEDNKPPSYDQSSVFQPQQKPTSTSRMSLDWNQPNDEAVMVFGATHGNHLMSSPYEFGSNDFKVQGHNLYGSAHYGALIKPHNSVFQFQPSRHQIHG
ncbi:transcription factor DIVARICATA-like [Quercus robur]|uniref:transcription factor DIVARICATA-like n=1 Tax=Quercus robur TaxID=38942 RepID=UPI0021626687|nr:transcription factor DIVARICATA-like [Quercus robur]XP_050250697.1 transcription factor DIVARICATA-like [Quercus robur]